MKTLLLNLIDRLDNKKTVSGICAWVLYRVAVAQGWADANAEVEAFIYGLIGVGLADKLRKLSL